MGQKLLILPEHMSSPTVFSGVRITHALVLCVCFADRCLSFCTFSFGQNLPRGFVCQFSQYYWGTLHNFLFFPIKADDETTILVVYDIYFINQLLKNDNNKNKQTENKQIKNKQKTNRQKLTNNQSQKRKIKRSIEIVHTSLLHMHLSKKTHSNGYFNFCQTILRWFQIILLITEEGS